MFISVIPGLRDLGKELRDPDWTWNIDLRVSATARVEVVWQVSFCALGCVVCSGGEVHHAHTASVRGTLLKERDKEKEIYNDAICLQLHSKPLKT